MSLAMRDVRQGRHILPILLSSSSTYLGKGGEEQPHQIFPLFRFPMQLLEARRADAEVFPLLTLALVLPLPPPPVPAMLPFA